MVGRAAQLRPSVERSNPNPHGTPARSSQGADSHDASLNPSCPLPFANPNDRYSEERFRVRENSELLPPPRFPPPVLHPRCHGRLNTAMDFSGRTTENWGEREGERRGRERGGSGSVPRVVVVGVKVKGGGWSGGGGSEIPAEDREVLGFTINNLVEPGNTLCVVAINKQTAVDGSSEGSDDQLLKTLKQLLGPTMELAKEKRVFVMARARFARHEKLGLIAEVLSLKASALVVGCSWKKGMMGGTKLVGEFCVKNLPPWCTVLMVKKDSCIFSKPGEKEEPSPTSIHSEPKMGENEFVPGTLLYGGVRERLVSAPNLAAGSARRAVIAEISGKQEYTMEELREATDNFSQNVFLGEGGCGIVYLGFARGEEVAVKRLKWTRNGAEEEAWKQVLTEIKVVRKVFHRNLVQLKGSCLEEGECLLVFDYLPNGSLDRRLRDPDQEPLTWNQRLKIAKGAAEGLRYLHEFCRPPIIHRDVKAANILLDQDMEAQVADFGLAKIVPEGPLGAAPFEVTAVMGTSGYVAPEYLRTGEVAPAIDVYAFGVVLLELLSAQPPYTTQRNLRYLADWAGQSILNQQYESIMDPRLEGRYDLTEARKVAQIASLCTDYYSKHRPKMGEVVRWLEDVGPKT